MIPADSDYMTPEQVQSAAFPTARFGRRGLDEAEVRGFCQWVAQGVGRLLNDNNLLEAEVQRLRDRLLDGKGDAGILPEDGHVQAVYLLSRAQQTADRCVAEAQEYSRELAEDARLRRNEILAEAKMRASMILEQAHNDGSRAADVARDKPEPQLPEAQRQELQAEIAYLRAYSDVCRTHLRAYMESLTRSIEEWERKDSSAARTARESRTVPQARAATVREPVPAQDSATEPVRDPVLHITP